MSQIKGENTKPEMLVGKFLFVNGFCMEIKNMIIVGCFY